MIPWEINENVKNLATLKKVRKKSWIRPFNSIHAKS